MERDITFSKTRDTHALELLYHAAGRLSYFYYRVVPSANLHLKDHDEKTSSTTLILNLAILFTTLVTSITPMEIVFVFLFKMSRSSPIY